MGLFRLFRRHGRAQGYAEFGISIAVVALIAMLGLDQIRAVIYTYFTSSGVEQNLNPPALVVGGPPADTDSDITCVPNPDRPSFSPWPLNTPVNCTATVRNGPMNTLVLLTTSAQGGSRGHGTIYAIYRGSPQQGQVNVPCELFASPPFGTCSFSYVPDVLGSPPNHTLTAFYNPGVGFVRSLGLDTGTVE